VLRSALIVLLSLITLGAASGCYYGHLAVGQSRLLWRREPIDQLLTDPATPDALRERLRLVQDVRAYARTLGLAVGEQYTSYVAWPGDRVITTLVATKPGEVEATDFRFPIIGRVPYKGYFDRAAAEREAEALRSRGLDVCVVPVAAYSTLGWLADPLTEPMLRADDLKLAETLLHELVHATAYVASDADFNEGVASFIGREAAARYLGEHGLALDERSPSELEAEQRGRNVDARLLAEQLRQFRAAVEALYATTAEGREREQRRSALESRTREQLAALPLQRADAAGLAERLPLGDACLALRGTYSDDLERHALLLETLAGDLPAFIDRLSQAAGTEAPRETFFATPH
jgi:predicted aminopeptidase